jgi:hypothetical protein
MKKIITNIKDIGQENKIQGYKTNGMQGKRQVIDSFYSPLHGKKMLII